MNFDEKLNVLRVHWHAAYAFELVWCPFSSLFFYDCQWLMLTVIAVFPSWDIRKRGFVPGAQASFVVVIDGDTHWQHTLRHALTPELKTLFRNLATQCETVVCCCVSSAQKALTVNLVDLLSFFDLTLCSHVLQMSSGQKVINAMTLSIGDGANDAYDEQNVEVSLVFFSVIHLDSLCIYRVNRDNMMSVPRIADYDEHSERPESR